MIYYLYSFRMHMSECTLQEPKHSLPVIPMDTNSKTSTTTNKRQKYQSLPCNQISQMELCLV
jgi:hypothetical protein